MEPIDTYPRQTDSPHVHFDTSHSFMGPPATVNNSADNDDDVSAYTGTASHAGGGGYSTNNYNNSSSNFVGGSGSVSVARSRGISGATNNQSFCVRVPDDEDNMFDHDDIDELQDTNNRYATGPLRETGLTREHKQALHRGGFGFIFFMTCLAVLSVLQPKKVSIEVLMKEGFSKVKFPTNLDSSYLDWSSDLDYKVTPLFWNIPASGGDVVEDVVASCLHLVSTSEVGALGKDGTTNLLHTVDIFGESYVNVDTTTPEGLLRAKNLALIPSGLADVVFSPMLYESSELFSPSEYKGYIFTVIRHPIERAVSMYHYLQNAKWDPLYSDEISKMTLEEYAASSYVENNWLTRMLTDRKGGGLTREDVTLAKEFLRRKVFVGMYSDLKVGIDRFEKRFGWFNKKARVVDRTCLDQKINASAKKFNHPLPEENTNIYNLLLRHNKFDMEVYEFAKELYKYQVKLSIYGRQH